MTVSSQLFRGLEIWGLINDTKYPNIFLVSCPNSRFGSHAHGTCTCTTAVLRAHLLSTDAYKLRHNCEAKI